MNRTIRGVAVLLVVLAACGAGPSLADLPDATGDVGGSDRGDADPWPADVPDAGDRPDALADVPDPADRPDDSGFDEELAEPRPTDPGFLISVVETRGFRSQPVGFVYVANPPAAEMVQTVRSEAGGCRFLEPAATGTCEPFCAWPGFCAADNTCHKGTPQRWAGDIALSGLNVTCSLPITTSGTYRYYTGTCNPSDPPDLFDAGATITATAAGGTDLPAFTLRTPGVDEITTPLPCDTFALQAGTPLQVDWQPSGRPGDRIRFTLISANHGTQFGHVECDVPDTGSLVVDASLVDLHLKAFNPAPSWNLARVHTSGTTVDGTVVALETGSRISCMYGY